MIRVVTDGIHHLRPSLAMIAGRTAFAGAVSMLPLPIVDEWLAGRARQALLKRIAELRRVDAADDAIARLAEVGDPLTDLAVDAAEAASLFRGAWRRLFRRATAAIKIARYGNEALETFTVATLFDHYCARHHVGAGVDLARARLLRAAIDGAISDARSSLTRRAIRRVGRATRGLLLAAPRRLGLLTADDGIVALSPEETALATRPADDLPSVARAWLEEITRAFDRRWVSVK